MKKIISTIICITLCLVLASCTAKEISTPPDTNNESSVSVVTTEKADKAETENNKKATKKSSNKIKAEKVPTKILSSSRATSEKSADKKPTTSKKTTQKPSLKATTTHITKKANTTKKPSTTAKTTTTTSTVTCTVTIECKKILGNMSSLKAGHEAYVPSNGIILNCYSVTIDNNETAYDAVKKACNDNSITMNAVSSSYGMYIAGFNNIDEKDCGGGSGWLFYVNGSTPNRSCNKCTVKNGDSIVFSYTC